MSASTSGAPIASIVSENTSTENVREVPVPSPHLQQQGQPSTISTPPIKTELISSDRDQLQLLKPPQLNNIQDLGDIVWISPLDSKPYVKIFLKTKNEHYKAEFGDLSARKQRDLIDKLSGNEEQKELVAVLEKYRRPIPASERFQKGSTKRPLGDDEVMYPDHKRMLSAGMSGNTSLSNLIHPPSLDPYSPSGHASSQLRPIQVPLFNPSGGHSVLTPASTPYRTSAPPRSETPHRLLENAYYSLEDTHRHFKELQDMLLSFRHENQLLRQENFTLKSRLDKSLSAIGTANGEEFANLEPKRVDALLAKYTPALQTMVAETIHRAFTELRSELVAPPSTFSTTGNTGNPANVTGQGSNVPPGSRN